MNEVALCSVKGVHEAAAPPNLLAARDTGRRAMHSGGRCGGGCGRRPSVWQHERSESRGRQRRGGRQAGSLPCFGGCTPPQASSPCWMPEVRTASVPCQRGPAACCTGHTHDCKPYMHACASFTQRGEPLSVPFEIRLVFQPPCSGGVAFLCRPGLIPSIRLRVGILQPYCFAAAPQSSAGQCCSSRGARLHSRGQPALDIRLRVSKLRPVLGLVWAVGAAARSTCQLQSTTRQDGVRQLAAGR
jgi:hypothetical protein